MWGATLTSLTAILLFGLFSVSAGVAKSSESEEDHRVKRTADPCSSRSVDVAIKCCQLPEVLTDFSCAQPIKTAPESIMSGIAIGEPTAMALGRKRRENEDKPTTKKMKKKKKKVVKKLGGNKMGSICYECALKNANLTNPETKELDTDAYTSNFIMAGGDRFEIVNAVNECRNDLIAPNGTCNSIAEKMYLCIRMKLAMNCSTANIKTENDCSDKLTALKQCNFGGNIGNSPISMSAMESMDAAAAAGIQHPHHPGGPSRASRKKKLALKRKKNDS